MHDSVAYQAGQLVLTFGDVGTLFHVQHQGQTLRYQVDAPSFEIDGQERTDWKFVAMIRERPIARGGREATFQYTTEREPRLTLHVTVRSYAASPIIRFRYHLTSDSPMLLTKTLGRDSLRYIAVRGSTLALANLIEIQLSHFDPVAHSYLPNIENYTAGEVYDGQQFEGPLALLHTSNSTLLLAYEHGANHQHAFFDFQITHATEERALLLHARKGNYYGGQPVGPTGGWDSVWFELGLAPQPVAAFLHVYRHFVLDEMCENSESRRPLLFYNTWNYQERNHYFRHQPYLFEMHAARMLAEIEVAHQLGIDVFVIDTGWYAKTGDWHVSIERFPDSLHDIKRKLDEYGMRLGLWFNPTVAALSSEVVSTHPEYEQTRGDQPAYRAPIWETEESASMCLASPYADAHLELMVQLHETLGVTYFKWDGISQYGCDSPLHDHGTVANTAAERADCYAFQMGRQMIHIVEEVSRRCPNVIVDFDITEGGRFVGLGFLAVGKYFLVNNGPYFSDFDIPHTTQREPDTINVFFYPGPARSRICRTGLRYDPIIPAILFLTHYLPDPPALSQRNSLASLVLGGNGIWGDLLSLSTADVQLLAMQLNNYKLVASAITRAYPRTSGFAGASPEVHEKIDTATASGVVVFFTVAAAVVTYATQPLAYIPRVQGADAWEWTDENRLKLTVRLEPNDARIVYVAGTT